MKSLSLNQMANVEGGQSAATRRKLCSYGIRLMAYAISINNYSIWLQADSIQWANCPNYEGSEWGGR
jgi:hypothetical protein